jgi:hypothetical protein
MMKKLKLCALVFFSATPLCTQAGLKKVMHDLLAGVTGNRERIRHSCWAAVNGIVAFSAINKALSVHDNIGVQDRDNFSRWYRLFEYALFIRAVLSIRRMVKFGARAYYNVAEHPSLC